MCSIKDKIIDKKCGKTVSTDITANQERDDNFISIDKSSKQNKHIKKLKRNLKRNESKLSQNCPISTNHEDGGIQSSILCDKPLSEEIIFI